MTWCARCGESTSDGLLLCAECVSRSNLRQSITIEMTTVPVIKLDPEGNIIGNVPGKGKAVAKAADMSAGSVSKAPLRVVRKIEWRNDRQNWEIGVWTFDRENNRYSETWFDLATSRPTWGPKVGNLDDQSIHGPRWNHQVENTTKNDD